ARPCAGARRLLRPNSRCTHRRRTHRQPWRRARDARRTCNRNRNPGRGKRLRADIEESSALHLEFDDNTLLPQLFGSHNSHLAQIEQRLDVSIASRGNNVTISGPREQAEKARGALNALYRRLKDGHDIDTADIDGTLRMNASGAPDAPTMAIATRKRSIMPRTPQQAVYLKAIDANDLSFGIGPAGTGKTYLAVAKA